MLRVMKIVTISYLTPGFVLGTGIFSYNAINSTVALSRSLQQDLKDLPNTQDLGWYLTVCPRFVFPHAGNALLLFSMSCFNGLAYTLLWPLAFRSIRHDANCPSSPSLEGVRAATHHFVPLSRATRFGLHQMYMKGFAESPPYLPIDLLSDLRDK